MSTKAEVEFVKKNVLAHLEKYPSSSISAYEIARVLGGISPNTVRRVCEELHVAGLLWKNQQDASHISWQYAAAVQPLTTVKP